MDKAIALYQKSLEESAAKVTAEEARMRAIEAAERVVTVRESEIAKRRKAVEEVELDQFCQTSGLAKFKRPRRYLFVRDIPKSPVGKLLRRKLVAGEYEPESRPASLPDNGTTA